MFRPSPVSKCNPRPYALRAWSRRWEGEREGGKHLVEMLKNWGFSTKIIDPCWALKCSSSENPQVRRQRLVWLWQIPRLTRKTPTWVGAIRVRVEWEWSGEGRERTRSSGCCNPFGLSRRFLSASNCQGLHEDCVLSSSAKEAAVGCTTRVTWRPVWQEERGERGEGSEDHWAAVELRAKLLLLLLSILTYWN